MCNSWLRATVWTAASTVNSQLVEKTKIKQNKYIQQIDPGYSQPYNHTKLKGELLSVSVAGKLYTFQITC